MKFLVLAMLLASPTAVASKDRDRPTKSPTPIKHCGPQGDEATAACLANELEHDRAAIFTVDCGDHEADVRVWLDADGDLRFDPPRRSQACGD